MFEKFNLLIDLYERLGDPNLSLGIDLGDPNIELIFDLYDLYLVLFLNFQLLSNPKSLIYKSFMMTLYFSFAK